MLDHYPDIIEHTLAALALCANLHSLTWIEENATAPETLPALLNVVRTLPLRALTIRTHNDLGADAWAQIIALEGVRRIALWCMEGPPRTLYGEPVPLGTSLTHLELGVSAFPYPPSERACPPSPSSPSPLLCVHVTNVDSVLQFSHSSPWYSPFVSRARKPSRSLRFSRTSPTSIRWTPSILAAPLRIKDPVGHPALSQLVMRQSLHRQPFDT